MFYATAGQQATQQPPSSRNAALGGGYARGGPPGFASRAADPNDFPALGSHPQLASTYAAQAQTSAGSGQQANQAQSNQHLSQQQQQQLFLAAQQQQQQQLGNVPPPPPGISGPNASAGNGGQPNGSLGGDEFPALGAGGELKDARLANYLRSGAANPSQHGGQPSSPHDGMGLSNGNISLPSASQSQSQSVSTNATPSTNPPHPHPQGQGSSISGAPSVTADSSWQQRPSSPRSSEPAPVVRPIQQILSSPVDKWGLKALLYEIQVHMNKTDRGVLSFGEELEELGMDVNSEEPLYPSFVTPWTDVNSMSQPPQIEESYHIPQCYNVNAPPVASKLTNFNEDTLLLAFYMSPQDVLQLEVAEELYARGWRYHTDLQIWLTSPTLANVDLQAVHSDASGQTHWIPGPFMYLDTRTWTRQRTLEDFTVDAQLLEVTKPAHMRLSDDSNSSGSAKGNGQSPAITSGSATGPASNGSQLSSSIAGSFSR